jgi:hypothetical protein
VLLLPFSNGGDILKKIVVSPFIDAPSLLNLYRTRTVSFNVSTSNRLNVAIPGLAFTCFVFSVIRYFPASFLEYWSVCIPD